MPKARSCSPEGRTAPYAAPAHTRATATGPGDPAATGEYAVPVIRQLLDTKLPLFGICLGQQWLFEGSEEDPQVPGLGVIPGRCRRLPPTLKVRRMIGADPFAGAIDELYEG